MYFSAIRPENHPRSWSTRGGELEEAPEVEQVEEVALDLEPARQPGPGEAARIIGDRQHIGALGREAYLRAWEPVVHFLDRIRAVRAEPGHIGHTQVRDMAAQRPVDQLRLADRWIHVRHAAHEALQGHAALFRSRHRHPAFKVILCRSVRSQTPGARNRLQWRQRDPHDGSVPDRTQNTTPRGT